MNDVHIAWVAGLFEGEGCINWKHNGDKRNRYVRCSVEMTDKDIIHKLQSLYPGPSVTYRDRNPGKWKPQWKWCINKTEDVRQFLIDILPYLGERRAYTALNALDHIELSIR